MLIDNYDADPYQIGDLVEFIGFNYTPDYYYEDMHERRYGLIVETIPSMLATKTWLYRVYWFKEGKTTETVAGHLRMVVENKHTNYNDGTQE